LLASRRQNILDLGEFIGDDLYWIEYKCYTIHVARHDIEEHLAKLESLTHGDFLDQVKTILASRPAIENPERWLVRVDQVMAFTTQ